MRGVPLGFESRITVVVYSVFFMLAGRGIPKASARTAHDLLGTWKYHETQFTTCTYLSVNGVEGVHTCLPESSLVIEHFSYVFDFSADSIVRMGIEIHLDCMDTVHYRTGIFKVADDTTVIMMLDDHRKDTVMFYFDGTYLSNQNSIPISNTVSDTDYCSMVQQTHVFAHSGELDLKKMQRTTSLVTALPSPMENLVAINVPPQRVPMHVRISDMQGRVVAEFLNVRTSPLIWNAHKASKGMYAGEIETPDGTSYVRIIR